MSHPPGFRAVAGPRCLAQRVVLAVAVSFGHAAIISDVANAQSNLSELVAEARSAFQPVTADQVSAAREVLLQRMQVLEQFVGPMSTNGQRWFDYLRWNELHSGIAQGGSGAISAFDMTLNRLRQDENGLELPQFQRVAYRLDHYRNVLAVSLWEKPAELYGRQLDAFERDLTAFNAERTAALEAAVGQRLHILADLAQAKRLVSAVRNEHARPNVYIDISTKLAAAGIEPINRNECVTDNILGTRIRGNAHTLGNVSISAVSSYDRMVLEFVSHGRSTSQNTGRNGPAVIRATGHTNFTASKRVELSDAAFSTQPAHANATTHSDIHSISKQGGGFGRRIVSRVGWKRARQNHHQADAIAADHTEDRIERQFNREVNERIGDTRRRYEQEFRLPLVRRGEFPEHLRFSSGNNLLSVEVTQANRGQLGASSDPPPVQLGHDASLRLHQTAVSNYVAMFLGGITASETNPDDGMKFDVKLPKWLQDAWQQQTNQPAKVSETEKPAPFKQWSMTFRERPIGVEFQDGRVLLTTHIAQLKSGDQSFSDWDIRGSFVPELDSGRVVLHRQGDLTVLPANFRGTLTSRQTAERRNLEKEINDRSAQGRGFPETIRFDPIELDGELAAAGPLEVREVTSDDHWISLALDRQHHYESW